MSTNITATLGSGNFSKIEIGSKTYTKFDAGSENTVLTLDGVGVFDVETVAGGNDVTFILDADTGAGTDYGFTSDGLGANGALVIDGRDTSAGVKLTSGNEGAQLFGGSGDDLLTAGANDAVLTGGEGADTFSFNTVKANGVIIEDYSYGEGDKIDLTADVMNSAFNVSNVDENGNITLQVTGGGNAVLVDAVTDGVAKLIANDKSELWYATDAAGYELDAAETTNAVTITGGDGADILRGNAKASSLNGGDGNDILWGGGKEADTMTGGDGIDNFWFGAGDGADVITDFKAGFESGNDVLTLYNVDAADVAFSNTSANVTLTIGTGRNQDTLTLESVTGNHAAVLVENVDGEQQKVLYIAKDADVEVSAENVADLYIAAGNAGMNFAGTEVDEINLYEDSYKNISRVEGSDTVVTTLRGGAGSETLTAGDAGAVLWGGDSKADLLVGESAKAKRDEFWFGAGDGKDVLSNFDAGFGKDNDALALYTVEDFASLKFGTDGSNTTLSLNKTDVLNFGGDIFTSNVAHLKVSFNKELDEKYLWVANNGGAEEVFTAENVADLYLGGDGVDTLNFSSISGQDLYLNLSDTTKYANIENLHASKDGNDTLIGGATAGVLSAEGSTGDVILWGGSSAAHTMVGGSGADEFWFAGTDGKDVVNKYSFDQGDVVHLWDQEYEGVLKGIVVNADKSDVTISIGSSELKIEGAFAAGATDAVISVDDKNFTNKNIVVAKEQKNATIAYRSDAQIYFGASTDTKLTVGEDATIYLGNGWDADNGTGTYFSALSIKEMDATNATNANVLLAGYSGANNTLIGGGKGSLTKMWGGGASSDSMVGGEGVDAFYFGSGDGNDTVTKSGADDLVVFWADSITDMAAQMSGKDLIVSTTKGDTLTIKNFADSTFVVGDVSGEAYSYDKETNSFVKK